MLEPWKEVFTYNAKITSGLSSFSSRICRLALAVCSLLCCLFKPSILIFLSCCCYSVVPRPPTRLAYLELTFRRFYASGARFSFNGFSFVTRYLQAAVLWSDYRVPPNFLCLYPPSSALNLWTVSSTFVTRIVARTEQLDLSKRPSLHRLTTG